MTHLLRRSAAALASASVVLTGALVAAPSAQASPQGDAVGWLADDLADGPFTYTGSDRIDHGLTLDAGLALADAGRRAPARRLSGVLEPTIDAYYAGDADGDPGSTYAGSLAKVATFVTSTGGDARSYDGVDLVQRLKKQVRAKGTARGRIVDTTGFGDLSNIFGQSFTVQALAANDGRRTSMAVSYLVKQQCRAGFFRLALGEVGKRQQRCGTGTVSSDPDTDATAIAVTALQSLPRADRTRATRAATSDALRWLRRNQRANGSFGGGPNTQGSNTNSTGLAAAVLGAGGSCKPARRAARWVARLQLDNGAVAYDRAAFDTAQQEGIDDVSRDQFRRATGQAALGLTYAGGCRG